MIIISSVKKYRRYISSRIVQKRSPMQENFSLLPFSELHSGFRDQTLPKLSLSSVLIALKLVKNINIKYI